MDAVILWVGGVFFSWTVLGLLLVVAVLNDVSASNNKRDDLDDWGGWSAICLILAAWVVYVLMGLTPTHLYWGIPGYIGIGVILAVRRYLKWCKRYAEENFNSEVFLRAKRESNEEHFRESVMKNVLPNNNKARLFGYTITWPFFLVRDVASLLADAVSAFVQRVFGGAIKRIVNGAFDAHK